PPRMPTDLRLPVWQPPVQVEVHARRRRPPGRHLPPHPGNVTRWLVTVGSGPDEQVSAVAGAYHISDADRVVLQHGRLPAELPRGVGEAVLPRSLQTRVAEQDE